MCNRIKTSLGLVVAVTLASVPLWAGSSVVGLVAGSLNTTIEAHAAPPQMVVFAGDRLQVNSGTAVIALSDGGRIVLGRDTTATFQRDERALTVVLSAGSVSLYYPGDRVGLRVQAGSAMVEATPGHKTIGEIAMTGGTVDVKAREGILRVNESERTVEVAKGNTFTVASKAALASVKAAGGVASTAEAGEGAGVASLVTFPAELTPPRPSPFQPPCPFPTSRECE